MSDHNLIEFVLFEKEFPEFILKLNVKLTKPKIEEIISFLKDKSDYWRNRFRVALPQSLKIENHLIAIRGINYLFLINKLILEHIIHKHKLSDWEGTIGEIFVVLIPIMHDLKELQHIAKILRIWQGRQFFPNNHIKQWLQQIDKQTAHIEQSNTLALTSSSSVTPTSSSKKRALEYDSTNHNQQLAFQRCCLFIKRIFTHFIGFSKSKSEKCYINVIMVTSFWFLHLIGQDLHPNDNHLAICIACIYLAGKIEQHFLRTDRLRVISSKYILEIFDEDLTLPDDTQIFQYENEILKIISYDINYVQNPIHYLTHYYHTKQFDADSLHDLCDIFCANEVLFTFNYWYYSKETMGFFLFLLFKCRFNSDPIMFRESLKFSYRSILFVELPDKEEFYRLLTMFLQDSSSGAFLASNTERKRFSLMSIELLGKFSKVNVTLPDEYHMSQSQTPDVLTKESTPCVVKSVLSSPTLSSIDGIACNTPFEDRIFAVEKTEEEEEKEEKEEKNEVILHSPPSSFANSLDEKLLETVQLDEEKDSLDQSKHSTSSSFEYNQQTTIDKTDDSKDSKETILSEEVVDLNKTKETVADNLLEAEEKHELIVNSKQTNENTANIVDNSKETKKKPEPIKIITNYKQDTASDKLEKIEKIEKIDAIKEIKLVITPSKTIEVNENTIIENMGNQPIKPPEPDIEPLYQCRPKNQSINPAILLRRSLDQAQSKSFSRFQPPPPPTPPPPPPPLLPTASSSSVFSRLSKGPVTNTTSNQPLPKTNPTLQSTNKLQNPQNFKSINQRFSQNHKTNNNKNQFHRPHNNNINNNYYHNNQHKHIDDHSFHRNNHQHHNNNKRPRDYNPEHSPPIHRLRLHSYSQESDR